MSQFLQLVGVLLILSLLAVIFVLELAGHLDIIEHRFPSLWVVMHSRPIIFALLIACLIFLHNDFKDALPFYPAPIVRISPPVPPTIQITTTEAAPTINVLPSEPKQRAYMAFVEPAIKFETGMPLAVDIECVNKSEVPAQRVSCNGQFFIMPLYDGAAKEEDEKKNFSTLESNMKPNPESERPSVVQGEGAFGTSLGPTVTTDLLSALNSNGYALLVTGILFYRDDVGLHRVELCRWAQPPLTNTPRVWHYCREHEGIVF